MTVTVYSLPRCVKCKSTEIALRRNGTEYDKVMLDEDPEAAALVKALGYEQAPVVVIREGEEIMESWSDFRLDRLNGLKVA